MSSVAQDGQLSRQHQSLVRSVLVALLRSVLVALPRRLLVALPRSVLVALLRSVLVAHLRGLLVVPPRRKLVRAGRAASQPRLQTLLIVGTDACNQRCARGALYDRRLKEVMLQKWSHCGDGAARNGLAGRLFLDASVDIVEAYDVVFLEIAAGLHLDNAERHFARILQTVRGADRDIGRLVLAE